MYFTYVFKSGIITLNQRMECDNMERLNVLTADCGAFYLRYLLDCGRITVEKYIDGVLSDSSAVETLLPETKAQKLLLIPLVSHSGTGAPSAAAFSAILPISVNMYHIVTSGPNSVS